MRNRDQRFNAAKLLQSDINAWRECSHTLCVFKQACLGGPRGTCRKTDGWPVCTQEGKERLSELGKRKQWQRSPTYEQETPGERRERRLKRELIKMDILLKQSGV